MGGIYGCGCKEVQYIDFLILLIPTPIVSVRHPYFLFIKNFFVGSFCG